MQSAILMWEGKLNERRELRPSAKMQLVYWFGVNLAGVGSHAGLQGSWHDGLCTSPQGRAHARGRFDRDTREETSTPHMRLFSPCCSF